MLSLKAKNGKVIGTPEASPAVTTTPTTTSTITCNNNSYHDKQNNNNTKDINRIVACLVLILHKGSVEKSISLIQD